MRSIWMEIAMFLEPSVNDLDMKIDVSMSNAADWIKTIDILRTAFLDIHPSVFEAAKKHFHYLSSVEQQLICNSGRGVLQADNTKKLFNYAKFTDKKAILIISTFNKCNYWIQLSKKILNLEPKDININFGADPNLKDATYSRRPIAGSRVYITDVNGFNRIISSEFFDGSMFGNEIDLMIVDKFFQTLLMLPKYITKELYSVVLVDDVYFSKNFDSVQCFENIAWTEEQRRAVKEISKTFEETYSIKVDETIKVLKEVDFILE